MSKPRELTKPEEELLTKLLELHQEADSRTNLRTIEDMYRADPDRFQNAEAFGADLKALDKKRFESKVAELERFERLELGLETLDDLKRDFLREADDQFSVGAYAVASSLQDEDDLYRRTYDDLFRSTVDMMGLEVGMEGVGQEQRSRFVVNLEMRLAAEKDTDPESAAVFARKLGQYADSLGTPDIAQNFYRTASELYYAASRECPDVRRSVDLRNEGIKDAIKASAIATATSMQRYRDDPVLLNKDSVEEIKKGKGRLSLLDIYNMKKDKPKK